MRMRLKFLSSGLLACLTFTPYARASVGVLEINPACVATGGVVQNNAVELNAADGIVGKNGTLVVGNASTSNAQAGIAIYLVPEQAGTAAAYRGNSCNGTTSCP